MRDPGVKRAPRGGGSLESELQGETHRVAIVGAGPAGFFAAEALLGWDTPVAIDVLNDLPAPYGLVRDGVAPDHQAIKSVARRFEKLLGRSEVRYFGNTRLGADVTVDDLRARYDQIVYAFGAQSERRLGIPGEDLAGSHAALRFVGWYNGHPGHRDEAFDLGCERVVVVGNGNVALDVARILVLSRDRLAATDVADHALAALVRSRVRSVAVLGRRGPVQASFTNPELREFGRLDGVSARARGDDFALDPDSAALLEGSARRSRNLATLKSYVGTSPRPGDRVVEFRFLLSPLEILSSNGRVSGVRVERNRLVRRKGGALVAEGTGETETIPCGMAIRSVGYRGAPVPGVPFDEKRGVVCNLDGRVRASDGDVAPGEYVVGWAKRGPSGVIGTNKADSAATVAKMAEDREAGVVAGAGERADDLARLLARRRRRWVDCAGWQRLQATETKRGEAEGRPRVKLCSVPEMLEAAGAPAGWSDD